MLLYLATWRPMTMDRRAVTALEYGLIARVIVGAIMLGFKHLAESLRTAFQNIGGSL